MAHNVIIAGLDIGTNKTCCVLADVSLETSAINVIGVGTAPSKGLKKGVVVDLDATTESIQLATSKAKQMVDNVELHSVWVGVTGEHVSSLNSKGVVAITSPNHEVSESDIKRAIDQSKEIVKLPDREILQVVPRGYTVDGQDCVSDPIGLSAVRLEVETHIITASTSFLDNQIKCIERAGLGVEGRVFEPIAAAEAVLFPAEKDLGVALVNLGGGTMDLAVYTNGEVYYSSVLKDIRGELITRDIAIGLRTDQEEAERIKIEHGYASFEDIDPEEGFFYNKIGEEPKEIPREVLISIIEPRMREIMELIQKEIVRSGKISLIPAGVVLTGGVAQLSGIIDLAEQVLELPVRKGAPEGLKGLSDTVESPAFATAVGLIKYAAKTQMELMESNKDNSIAHGLKSLLSRFFRK